MNRRFVLRERPRGRLTAQTFARDDREVPEPGDGEALVRVGWISIDPTNRAWLDEKPTYLPPVGLGEVMRGRGLGRVVASRSPDHRVGDLLLGFVGWQDYALVGPSAPLTRVEELPGVTESSYLGVYGMTGLTAWVGLSDIGRPRPGETVVVSAAAGAVGSVAGQLAKAAGARVVGIAGGAEKCRQLVETLRFDAAIDHRASSWPADLVAATPHGIDVDFENVGGPMMDAIFRRLNVKARVALCGLISGYNGGHAPIAADAFTRLLVNRVHLEGFIVLDHLHRLAESKRYLHGLVTAGKLQPRETILDGFDRLPTALDALFDGQNIGKLVVRVRDHDER